MFKTTINTLEQFKFVLSQISTSDYETPCSVLSNSTIGQHTRHVIELFQCLLHGYDTASVNYDKRERNKRIEQERDFAILKIEEIVNAIEKEDKPIAVEQCFAEKDLIIKSNYYREVVYNLEHTIHHKALIKIGIKHLCELELPESFGVAPSTIEYKKQCVQ